MARIEAAARARADALRDDVRAAAQVLPGISARIEDDDVLLSGRGLGQRWLRDARLRDVARDVLDGHRGEGLR